MACGIIYAGYAGENLLTHKIYIGQTTFQIKNRINNHKYATTLIGYMIREYGWENFVWVILEECDNREQMIEREKFWIKKLNCKFPNGYNLSDGGTDTGRITLQSVIKNNNPVKSVENEISREYYSC